MKADAALRDIPVIMISALDEVDSVIRCIELGAEDYLPKPFNPTLLRARVGASLEKKRLRDEVRGEPRAAGAGARFGARAAARHAAAASFPPHRRTQPVAGPRAHAAGARGRRRSLRLLLRRRATCSASWSATSPARVRRRRCSWRAPAVSSAWPYSWRERRTEDIDPALIVEAVNRELCQNNRRSHVRDAVSRRARHQDRLVLTYVNAGHPRRTCCAPGEAPELIDASRNAARGSRRARTRREPSTWPGDALFVCTDGVIEAMNDKGELYLIERLQASSARRPTRQP